MQARSPLYRLIRTFLGWIVGAPTINTVPESFPIQKSEDEWKQILGPERYAVMRRSGTERAFTGEYWDKHDDGVYRCAACGTDLFDSKTKFDSGSGWPSFWDAVGKDRVALKTDTSHGMTRVEAVCARCGGHLGHVFDDGPGPTGQRYCINSACLRFDEKKA